MVARESAPEATISRVPCTGACRCSHSIGKSRIVNFSNMRASFWNQRLFVTRQKIAVARARATNSNCYKNCRTLYRRLKSLKFIGNHM